MSKNVLIKFFDLKMYFPVIRRPLIRKSFPTMLLYRFEKKIQQNFWREKKPWQALGEDGRIYTWG